MSNLLSKLRIDPKEVERRFSGYTQIYLKYLREFPSDDSYAALLQAFETNDADAIAKAAHALKGVSSTLILNDLFSPCVAILEAARSGDVAKARRYMPQLNAAYEQVMQALANE